MRNLNEKDSLGVSIKNIKGNLYVYTWEYRKKIIQNKKRPQKYNWKYFGPVNCPRFHHYLQRLSLEKQCRIHEEVRQKKELIVKEKEIMSRLMMEEERLKQRHQIEAIRNSITRNDKLKKFESKIRLLAQEEIHSGAGYPFIFDEQLKFDFDNLR
jgi:hypothetical protein